MLEIIYYIKNNDDWKNLKEGEFVVDISNDAYFGFRAMEKKARKIKYDPSIIDSLVRVGKESKKFPETAHLLVLDQETLGFESREGVEAFTKAATRAIEEVLSLNPELKIDFFIVRENSDIEENKKIYELLREIYKSNI